MIRGVLVSLMDKLNQVGRVVYLEVMARVVFVDELDMFAKVSPFSMIRFSWTCTC